MFLLLSTPAWAVSVTRFEHSTANVAVGSMKFTASLFVVHFDQDILMASDDTPVSALPLTNTLMPSMGQMAVATGGDLGGGPPGMPDAMIMQAGGMSLECPCAGCADDPAMGCSGGVCAYSSVMDPAEMMHGPPRSLMPMPAVEEAGSVLFRVFANTMDPAQVTALPGALVAIKITSNYEEWSGQWQRYIPEELDLSACRIKLTDGFYKSAAGNGTVIGGSFTTPASVPFDPGCTAAGVTSVIGDLRASMDALDDADGGSSRAEMERRTWTIASHQLRDGWVGCEKMVERLVTAGDVERTFPGTKRCVHPYRSAPWDADPCCNHGLQFTQCCIPRAQTATIQGVTGTNDAQIASTCEHPARIAPVLKAHIANIEAASQCDAKAKNMGASWEVTHDLIRFMDTCWEKIFGKNGPPTCISDSDCYTSCDRQRGECVVPHDNPDPAWLKCATENMNERMGRKWRKDWGKQTNILIRIPRLSRMSFHSIQQRVHAL